MDKKTAIVTQLIMTFMMATVMSGIMSLIALGPTATWLAHWPIQIIIAWPIAFIVTQILWPIAMRLGRKLAGPRT